MGSPPLVSARSMLEPMNMRERVAISGSRLNRATRTALRPPKTMPTRHPASIARASEYFASTSMAMMMPVKPTTVPGLRSMPRRPSVSMMPRAMGVVIDARMRISLKFPTLR